MKKYILAIVAIISNFTHAGSIRQSGRMRLVVPKLRRKQNYGKRGLEALSILADITEAATSTPPLSFTRVEAATSPLPMQEAKELPSRRRPKRKRVTDSDRDSDWQEEKNDSDSEITIPESTKNGVLLYHCPSCTIFSLIKKSIKHHLQFCNGSDDDPSKYLPCTYNPELCSMKFNHPNGYDLHMAVHRGEKSQCPVCKTICSVRTVYRHEKYGCPKKTKRIK